MSTPETPRTWTLKCENRGDGDWGDPWLLVADGPDIAADGTEIEVIEKALMDVERERLLDLLVALEELLSSSVDLAEGDDCNVDAARDLLREYGRLGKEES